MATYTWVDLRIPEAALLADLNGILGDLIRSREFAELLNAQYESTPPNWKLVEPLSVAMTVTYARAFSGGIRYHLTDNDLSVLTDQQRANHQFLRDYRDKHIAHSVNEFEENIVRATYCVEKVQSEGISSIGFGGGRVMGLSGEDTAALIEITLALESYIRGMMQQEEQKLLSIVRAMPLDKVLAGGQKIFDPSMAKVAQRRKL